MEIEIKFRAFDSISHEMHSWYVIGNTHLPLHDFIKLKHYHLMQFTGLKDKKGVDIYIGDILKTFRGSIIYFKNMIEYYFWMDENYSAFQKVEIIGNIHENPELL